MVTARVDIPEWVTVPTSCLHQQYTLGKVIEVWRNQIKVQYWGSDNLPHIGIYGIADNIIKTATGEDFLDLYTKHEEQMGYVVAQYEIFVHYQEPVWAIEPRLFLCGLQDIPGDFCDKSPYGRHDTAMIFTKDQAEDLINKMHPSCKQGWKAVPVAQFDLKGQISVGNVVRIR